MKTQDQDAIKVQSTPSSGRNRMGSRLAGIGAVVVVVLIVGASVALFTELSLLHKNAGTSSARGQWIQSLKGYAVTELVAAQSNPAVLYACAEKYAPGAQQSALPPSYDSIAGNTTLLRSTDTGAHWQDLGQRSGAGPGCQLAVNPNDSNDVYQTVIGAASPSGQVESFLKHSVDGGKTWTTIRPVLKTPFAHTPVIWSVSQISLVGGRFFGVQLLNNGGGGPVHPGVEPAITPLAWLVSSADGGKSWTVIDGQLNGMQQGIWSYVVDPTNAATIYVVAGAVGLVLPMPLLPAPTAHAPTWVGMNETLYKSSDGGTTWHTLLNNLPFGTQVHLATAQSNMVYVGGSLTAIPVLPAAPGVPGVPQQGNSSSGPPTIANPAIAYPVAGFHLRMSRDGGATWRAVPDLSNAISVQNWFVGAHGDVFAVATTFTGSSSSSNTGVPATAVAATAVVVTPGVVPPGAPPLGATPVSSTNSVRVVSVPMLPARPQVALNGPQSAIQHYDPAANKWSALAAPPVSGMFLAVTAVSTSSGDVLWLLGVSGQGEPVLYRYQV